MNHREKKNYEHRIMRRTRREDVTKSGTGVADIPEKEGREWERGEGREGVFEGIITKYFPNLMKGSNVWV